MNIVVGPKRRVFFCIVEKKVKNKYKENKKKNEKKPLVKIKAPEP